jgi:hypothetical protein
VHLLYTPNIDITGSSNVLDGRTAVERWILSYRGTSSFPYNTVQMMLCLVESTKFWTFIVNQSSANLVTAVQYGVDARRLSCCFIHLKLGTHNQKYNQAILMLHLALTRYTYEPCYRHFRRNYCPYFLPNINQFRPHYGFSMLLWNVVISYC